MEGTTIVRDAPIHTYPFTQFFKGFEKVKAVQETFGEETERVLKELKVEFYSSPWGYMGVNQNDGHILVSAHYLKHGDERDLYLDIVHELVHVKQWRQGKELFEEGFEYVDLPTEIEAYRHTVKEARRLGMTDPEIYEYLKVQWIDEKEIARLAKNIGVKVEAKAPEKVKARA